MNLNNINGALPVEANFNGQQAPAAAETTAVPIDPNTRQQLAGAQVVSASSRYTVTHKQDNAAAVNPEQLKGAVPSNQSSLIKNPSKLG